jgi:outer membrane protein assembly factor BamA
MPFRVEVEMMHRPLVVALVTFAVFAAPSFVAGQDFCDKQFVVSGVSLPETTRLSRSEQAAIRARLIGRCFEDQEQLGELAGRVRDTLQNFGYLRATVSEPTMTIADASRHPQPVSLNVEFAEGPRFKVREIVWHGFRAVSSDQLMAVSQIQVEDVLDMSKVRETVAAVRKLYAANGYPKASIVPEVSFLGGVGVCVSFRIAEGTQSP